MGNNTSIIDIEIKKKIFQDNRKILDVIEEQESKTEGKPAKGTFNVEGLSWKEIARVWGGLPLIEETESDKLLKHKLIMMEHIMLWLLISVNQDYAVVTNISESGLWLLISVNQDYYYTKWAVKSHSNRIIS